jgi:hypothetical protein
MNDPDKGLAPLYNIRDGLFTKFGGEKQACTTLKISKSDWSDLGILCNPEPLQQGRHPGWHYENLRDATGDELSKARRIAKDMIKAYILYLETNS